MPEVILLGNSGLIAHVYVDVVFLVNFIMDFFILWATGKIGKIRVKMARILAAAFFGAMYSLVVFFPEWPVLTSLVAKVLCSLGMIIIAFAPLSPGLFFRSVAYLYLISFAMGGAVIGTLYLTYDAPGYIQAWNGAAVVMGNIHYGWLSLAIGVAIVLGVGGVTYVRKHWLKQNLVGRLIIHVNDSKAVVDAFIDTGNQLVDPLTQKPVLVVEVNALKEVLPAIITAMIKTGEEVGLSELAGLLDANWTSRIRVIP